MQESGTEPSKTSSSPTAITRPAQTSQTPATSRGHGVSDTIQEREIIPANVTEYEELKKVPYLVDYLGLGDIYGISGITRQGQELDAFVKSEIERLHLDNSFQAYIGIIREIESGLGVNPNERPDHRLQKLTRWVKHVLIPQRKIEERRKKILHA